MDANKTIITKSDFRTFCEAPRHLWAKKNNQLDASEADALASIQGKQIERMAMEYVQRFVVSPAPGLILSWQETHKDGPYLARADALVGREHEGVRDLYEIKSGTEVKREDIEDVAFQTLIFKKKYKIRHVFLVLVNSAYTRHGPLDLEQLLKVEEVTDQVDSSLADVDTLRAEALQAALTTQPDELEHCWKPDECVCREICHPGLPDFSIYNIPRLSNDKKRQLESMGIRAAKDIPSSFALSDLQRNSASLAQRNVPSIDAPGIRRELAKIAYPVYFLDYETCNLAIPQYEDYKPYQQIVFQYSLHRLDGPKAELQHYEHLSTSWGEPSAMLVASLRDNLGAKGSVLVWNAAFEKSRNQELALLQPQHADFLLDVNSRIHDLMEVVSKGLYLHPGFKGRSSIKKVLPVVVPALGYADMDVNDGRKASLAWWQIVFGSLDDTEKQAIAEALLAYCKLDTLAIVEIFRRFAAI